MTATQRPTSGRERGPRAVAPAGRSRRTARSQRAAGLLLSLAGTAVLMGCITAEARYPGTSTTHTNTLSHLGASEPPDSVVVQPSAAIFDGTMLTAGTMTLVAAWLVHRALHRKAVAVPTGLRPDHPVPVPAAVDDARRGRPRRHHPRRVRSLQVTRGRPRRGRDRAMERLPDRAVAGGLRQPSHVDPRRPSGTAPMTGPRVLPASTASSNGSATQSALDSPPRWAPPPPTPADLARQVRDVVADLPRFLTAPLLRPWHRRWGATRAEVSEPMPGDDLFRRAQLQCTRAITIAATPEEVWPWLVQVGCLRAGWYSDDLLDNLAHPSARELVPELQDLEIGKWLPMAPTPSATSAFVVDSLEVPRWMLWRTPSSSWAWRLVPLPDGSTRLVTRLHAVYDWHRVSTVLWMPLMEFGDFPMMRRMLRGIRERAEAEHRRLGR